MTDTAGQDQASSGNDINAMSQPIAFGLMFFGFLLGGWAADSIPASVESYMSVIYTSLGVGLTVLAVMLVAWVLPINTLRALSLGDAELALKKKMERHLRQTVSVMFFIMGIVMGAVAVVITHLPEIIPSILS